ncbi:MAG: Ni/Fe-hydrogenase, b-type cytochrome subunit [Proteobacteria bacterium]|nr:Ni/Fe-hydrogenase, b-type cytochrome subunit [Pseudomonadota bacterium]
MANRDNTASLSEADELARARATMFDVVQEKTDAQEMQVAVFVYEAPLRIWHWFNAAMIVVLCVTGYFIGLAPRTVAGEASDNYIMGYIRFVHFAAGQGLCYAFLGRIIFAFTGNHFARELFYIPFWRKDYWDNVWAMVKWYSFSASNARRFVGHNALARIGMFFMYLIPSIYAMLSGLSLYSEGLGMDHWLSVGLGQPFINLHGGSLLVHALHRFTMWIIISFVMVHIYVAVREEIMGPQSMISTMVSGWRMFKGKQG